MDLVLDLAKQAPEPISYVNLGGGLGIPYFEKDGPLDLDGRRKQHRAVVRGATAPGARRRTHRDRARPLPRRRGRAST